MNIHTLIYKIHKWLAVAAGLFTLFWFASGIVLLLPRSWWDLPGSKAQTSAAAKADLREVSISPAEAISAIDRTTGQFAQVEEIRVRRLGGQFVYEISAGAGTHLVNGQTGEPILIDEEAAARLARNALQGGSNLGAPVLLRNHDWDYASGPLPVYRFALQDSHATRVYVAMQNGQIQITHRRGRIREFLVGLHFLGFLRPFLPALVIRLSMLAFAGLGLLMALFGSWILYLQFRKWWHTARRTA